MSSAHPDFANVASENVSSADILKLLQEKTPEAIKTLNGRLLEIDAERGVARFRFEIVPAFCHSDGKICQGGFLTGMVDTSMAHAAIAKGLLRVAVPTLEIKVNYLRPTRPGRVHAEATIVRLGRIVG